MRSRLGVGALWLGVALLAVGPLVLTLTRAEDYRSSVMVSLSSDSPSADDIPNPRKLLAGPLEVPDLQGDAAKEVGWFDAPDDLPDYVAVSAPDAGDPRALVVTARGPTPEEARELADVTAPLLLQAAEASVRFTQPLQLRRIRRALRRDDLSRAERDELRSRRAEIADSMRTQEPVFAERPGPATLAKERVGDRIVGALPGRTPLRPNPVWAGVAGVALAMAMALWVLVLSSPSRSGGAPSRS